MQQRRLFVVLMILAALLLATTLPRALAQGSQVLNIAVLGAFDGPTARGLSMAVDQLNTRGPLRLPNGQQVTPAVVVANARTLDEVNLVLGQLKQVGVAAIFGPDDNLLAAQASSVLSGAGVPVFTAATSRAVRTGGLVFRTQSPDSFQLGALADVLINDRKLSRIAIYQGGEAYSAPAGDFSVALAQRGQNPAATAIQAPDAPIAQSLQALAAAGPDAIVAFGDNAQVAELYRAARAGNFNGVFATPNANDRAFIELVPPLLRAGIYSVSGWSYASETLISVTFTREYIKRFGDVPNALSAAAYDAANALFDAVQGVGTGPNDLAAKILTLPIRASVQGTFDPTLGNNLLNANAAVTMTGQYGAGGIVALFDRNGRAPGGVAIQPTQEAATQAPPTRTPRPPTRTPAPTNTPTATFTPSLTPTATATPQGVVATILGRFLNVRTGPGTDYDILGRLNRGEQVQLVGANADFTWFVIIFRAQQAWISGDRSLVSIFGDVRTLPFIQPPPTPTLPPPPTFTPTFTPEPFADIVLVSASLNPPIPAPGQPFTLTAIILNQGALGAGEFAVATSFKPGEVYSAQIVPGLGPGQQTTVNLTATVAGTGVETIAIVLDLNNQLDEGPNGKANNKPTFSYKIDRPFVTQGTFQIAPLTSVDFFGGTQDATFSGSDLAPINGALFGLLGVPLTQVHYDYLSPAVVNINTPIPVGSLQPGTVIGLYTAEGARGILQVASYNGPNIVLNYYIYQP